jgi:hypothetical protein
LKTRILFFFKHRDVHIFIADLSHSLAHRVFCIAYHLGLYGTNYAWILPELKISLSNSIKNFYWWEKKEEEKNILNNIYQTNCSIEEMSIILNGHFVLNQAFIRPFNENGKEEKILASGKVYLFLICFFGMLR